MAKHTPKPFITRIQAEGTSAEKHLEQEETYKEAQKLALQMPGDFPNRITYVRNLSIKVFRGLLDYRVFHEFLKMTNSWDLFYSTEARARLIAEKGGKK